MSSFHTARSIDSSGVRVRTRGGCAGIATALVGLSALTGCGASSNALPSEVHREAYVEVLMRAQNGAADVGVASFRLNDDGMLIVVVTASKETSLSTLAIGSYGSNQLKVYPEGNQKGELRGLIPLRNGEEKRIPITIDGVNRGELFSAKTDLILSGKGANAGLSFKQGPTISHIPVGEYCRRVSLSPKSPGFGPILDACGLQSGNAGASISGP